MPKPHSRSHDRGAANTSANRNGGNHELSLKQLLKSSDILLKPPSPLSSNPPDLIQRLKQCSRSIPKEWRRRTPEWNDEDELEQVGDNEVAGDGVDEERRKRRRDELVFVVGKRCFALTKAMQVVLEKECWPKEQRGGLDQNEFLLGTADLRLIRLMLQHTTFSYLLPLTAQYADALPNVPQESTSVLSSTLEMLLQLLKTAGPPTPAAGPSSRAPTPPTVITQTLLTSHLIPIFLSTLILGYTPSIPSETHAPLRSAFMQSLLSLSPGHAISCLVNVLKLLVSGRKEGAKINGWVREWPKYPEGIINGLLTAQVRRPGGVRGLMENVLGETAKTDDVASIDGKRLDHIFNVLVRIPRQVTPEIYYPWLLSELFSMIPLTDSSHHHPIAYVNTACYCIQRLWASNRPLIGEWLKSKLHSPWYPKLPASMPNGPIVATTWEHCQRSVQNMRLLIIHNPTSPEFANFIVGTVLPPLFSLYTFVSEQNEKQLSTSIMARSSKGKASTGGQLIEDVLSVLKRWGQAVDQAEGVKGLWSIIEGGQGWGKGELQDEVESFWDMEGEGVRLMARRRTRSGEPTEVTLPTISALSETVQDDVSSLSSEEHRPSPDPTLFCHLIKSLDRPEIASEVILRLLDLWRIKTATETEPSMESLLDLQLTIEMMELLGAQLFTKPDQVLGFVESVLNDQVESLDQGDQHHSTSHGKGDSPLIMEVGGSSNGLAPDDKGENDDDAAPDGKRGLIEVACQLLASLEAEGQLDSSNLTIVHPILAHLEGLASRSPSVSIRNASREARLLLLSHQSASPLRDLSNPAKLSAESYRQAMAFVADPVLPVRAHGLAMLRELVFSPYFDEKLIPQILGVFIRELDNSDSFIYLTAIKGLCGMVDRLGRDVFEVLMQAYRQCTITCKRSTRTQKEDEQNIDRILRLAEALNQVTERTGEASHQYSDILLPILTDVYPDPALPTIVRSSALSLISNLARVAPLSVLFETASLIDAMLDLLQTEAVASSPFRPIIAEVGDEEAKSRMSSWGKSKKIRLVDDEPDPEPEEGVAGNESSRQPVKPRIVDAEPTKANDGKHPTLRRAALTTLGWVLRVLLFVSFADDAEDDGDLQVADKEFELRLPSASHSIKLSHDNNDTHGFDLSHKTMERASTILDYLLRTDDDEVTRQHAESVLADLKMLQAGTGGSHQSLPEIELPSIVERKLQAMRIS